MRSDMDLTVLRLVGAHQNLNGSRDLTMPLSGIVALPTIDLFNKFEVSISTH